MTLMGCATRATSLHCDPCHNRKVQIEIALHLSEAHPWHWAVEQLQTYCNTQSLEALRSLWLRPS